MARKRKKVWNETKARKSAARKAAIADGGLGAWMKRPATFKDRKAVANKKACRQAVAG